MNKKLKGFTLIELVIVMAIFMFIIGAAIGIFISIVRQQRNILAQMELLNEVSYIEEYISKAVRMATVDTTGTTCLQTDRAGATYLLTYPDGSFYNGIRFINQSEADPNLACEEFYLDNDGALKISQGPILGTGQGTAKISDLSDSSKFTINSIRFGIDGYSGCQGTYNCPISDQDEPGGVALQDFQPRITVLINISIKNAPDVPPMTIQTTVSRRNINLPIP